MDAIFQQVAVSFGASVDQVKLIFCLLISYPLGSVFIRLPSSNPALKHAFNIVVTSFFMLAVLGLWSGAAQLLLDVLGTYYIAANVKGPYMPWVVFSFVMGHLTVNHIIRTVYSLGYETFEITGPQMVLTMKLTTFAWNVFDGGRPVEELDQWQKDKRVVQHPSLLEFLGYSFYFPGVLVGPYLEFADYMALINGTIYKQPVNEKSRRLVPHGRKRVAYRKMVVGLVLLGAYVSCIPTFNYGVAIQSWFIERSFIYRLCFYQLSGFVERAKYYAIWTLTEGAAILTGFGFSGYDSQGKTYWNGAANVNIVQIELAPNFKVLLDNWNMKTNVWLRECVYKRVTRKGKKPGFRSSMITFATSAFWHGIAGGYYLTFFAAGFVQTIGRLCRGYLRPLVLPPAYPTGRTTTPPPQTPLKRAYDVVGVICTILALNYLAAPFMLLTVRDSLAGWRALNWYGHWMIGSSLVFFYGGGMRFLKETQEARAKKAGLVAQQTLSANATEEAKRVQVLPPVDEAAREIERGEFMRALNESKST